MYFNWLIKTSALLLLYYRKIGPRLLGNAVFLSNVIKQKKCLSHVPQGPKLPGLLPCTSVLRLRIVQQQLCKILLKKLTPKTNKRSLIQNLRTHTQLAKVRAFSTASPQFANLTTLINGINLMSFEYPNLCEPEVKIPNVMHSFQATSMQNYYVRSFVLGT